MVSVKQRRKPLVVYLHRYPPEYEAEQLPVMRDVFDSWLPVYDVVYCCMHSPKKPDPKLRRGLRMMHLPFTIDRTKSRDKWLKTALYYLYLPITLWKIKRLNPDVVIPKETLPFLPSLAGLLGKPMFMEVSDWWWPILLGKSKISKKIAKWLEHIEVKQWNRKKTLVIAHTKTEAKLVEEKGMSHERIWIINAPLYGNVYQPSNADDVRKKLGFIKQNFVAALHGIIDPRKGYDQILRWWKKLTDIHSNWKLLIIGSGAEAWCRREIERLGLRENVIMTGFLPTQQEVNKYLNAADCLLATRRNTEDNLGVIPSSLYHNLPTGKPTVVTGLGGMAEIIQHGINGYLYKPDSYESFKSVLEYIASHPKEAKKVGKAGIKRAKECFDPKRAVGLYKKLVDKLMGM